MLDNAGELNRKITVKKTSITVDDEGNRIPTETAVCTCWAKVKDATTREFYDADRRQMEYVVNFIIRHRTDLNEGMTVWLDCVAHEIKEINQGTHRRDFMLLRTNRRVATP